jgi:hypothetical protein
MTSSTASPHNPDQIVPPSHGDLSLPQLEVSSISNTLNNTEPSKSSLSSPGSDLPSIQSVNPATGIVKREDLARSTSSVDREGKGGSTLTVCAECKQMVQKVQTSQAFLSFNPIFLLLNSHNDKGCCFCKILLLRRKDHYTNMFGRKETPFLQKHFHSLSSLLFHIYR